MERVMKKVKYTAKMCLSYFAVDPKMSCSFLEL